MVFETGYGPSGLPHIGTFGEVARTTMVRHAFRVLTEDKIKTRLIAFSDDSNDFSGNPYVIHQTSGFSLTNGRKVDLGTDKSSTTIDPSAPQVVDGKHDAQVRTGAPTTINEDSPVDVVNIRYGCDTSGTSTLVGATMQLSGLTFVPPDEILPNAY